MAQSERGGPCSLPMICLIAATAIADDVRIRRQGDAFHKAGWRVVGVGLAGAHSPDPDWPILTCAQGRVSLQFRARRTLALLCAKAWPSAAHLTYQWLPGPIGDIYTRAAGLGATVWLANDLALLPLAARLADESGGIYGYDSHEFATEEFADKFKWRFLDRPMISALEREFIQKAAVVSTVSDGIARCLDSLYALKCRPVVVRNTPNFEPVAFRQTPPDRIRVLYHGIVTPGRGLEVAIDSVADWRPQFDLTIRGPGGSDYLDTMRRRIAERGLSSRVSLVPPVPMTELVREAAAYDIGFFALPGSSRHNEFALPNKFFEYVMAGLALCLTDLPEMARLVREYNLGVTFRSVDPQSIAEAINALEPASIDRYKRNALEAARELCWEREAERLVSAYRAVRSSAMPQAA